MSLAPEGSDKEALARGAGAIAAISWWLWHMQADQSWIPGFLGLLGVLLATLGGQEVLKKKRDAELRYWVTTVFGGMFILGIPVWYLIPGIQPTLGPLAGVASNGWAWLLVILLWSWYVMRREHIEVRQRDRVIDEIETAVLPMRGELGDVHGTLEQIAATQESVAGLIERIDEHVLPAQGRLESVIDQSLLPLQYAMQRYAMPRALAPEQVKIIGEHLREHPPFPIMIVVPRYDTEAEGYRSDIRQALEAGGWAGIDVTRTDEPIQMGLGLFGPRMTGSERRGSPTPSPHTIIGAAFRGAGVPINRAGSQTSRTNIEGRIVIEIGARRRDRYADFAPWTKQSEPGSEVHPNPTSEEGDPGT